MRFRFINHPSATDLFGYFFLIFLLCDKCFVILILSVFNKSKKEIDGLSSYVLLA